MFRKKLLFTAVLFLILFPIPYSLTPISYLLSPNTASAQPQESIDDLIGKNLDLKLKTESLTKENDSLQAANQTLLTRMKELMRENEAVLKEIEGLKASLSQEKSKFAELEKTGRPVNGTEKKESKGREKKGAWEAIAKKFEQDSLDAAAKLENLNKEITELKDSSQRSIDDLSTRLSESQKNLEEKTFQLAQEKEGIEKINLSKELAELKDSSLRNIKDLNALISQLTEDNKNIKKEKMFFEGKINKFRDDTEKARKDRAIAVKQAGDYAKSSAISKASDAGNIEKIKSLQDENQWLNNELLDVKQNLAASRRSEAEAKDKHETLERQTKKERVDMHYNMAIMFQEQGRYANAEREYLKALVINPLDAGVHYNVASLYEDYLHNSDKAIYHYKQYLKLNPSGEFVYKVRDWVTRFEEKTKLNRTERPIVDTDSLREFVDKD